MGSAQVTTQGFISCLLRCSIGREDRLSLDFEEEQRAADKALQKLENKGCRAQLIIFDNLSTLRRSVSENDNDAAK
jgi:hypothetical protein